MKKKTLATLTIVLLIVLLFVFMSTRTSMQMAINGATEVTLATSPSTPTTATTNSTNAETNKHEHRYYIDIMSPTCTTEGYTAYVCECGDIGEVNYTDALGHDMGAYTLATEPTCTTIGIEMASCLRCEYCETREVDPTGHDMSEWRIHTNATCEESGMMRSCCNSCDYFEEMHVDAIGHNYKSHTVAPTCTDNGYTINVCENCESEYVDAGTMAIGHTWDKWYVSKSPTYESEGEERRSCNVCGTTESRSIDKIPMPLEYINLDNYQRVISYAGLNEEEKEIVTLLLKEYERYRNGEVGKICVKRNGHLSFESHNNIASFFAIYTGNFNQKNEIVWVCINLNDNTTQIRLMPDQFHQLMLEKEAMDAELENVLSTFTEGSDEHKLRQIADWLRDNFVYEKHALDACKAFETKKANCNGFAFLFQTMAARLGIQSDVCIGYTADGSRHAWNRVTLSDGEERFYDISFYNSNGRTKYLHAKESPWSDYAINDYWY